MAKRWAPRTIDKDYLLVVEGIDEQNFFESLAKHVGLRSIQVQPMGGRDQLRSNLGELRKTPGFSRVRCLGVTRDADDDPQAAFQSVCGALQDAELPVPTAALQRATGRPDVVVFILPRPRQAGALEDLCLESLEQTPAIACVEEYIECLKNNDCLLCNDVSKGRMHAFLASQPDPERRLGEAACAGCWDFNHEVFAQLRDFLAALVSEG